MHAQSRGMKRKRPSGDASFSLSDDSAARGDSSSGAQILPVASLLPADGIPQDGAQYLLSVRLNAQSLPITTRAINPYAMPETATLMYDDDSMLEQKSQKPIRHPNLPSEEWRTTFTTRFTQFRKNVKEARLSPASIASAHQISLPATKDRPKWYQIIHITLAPSTSTSRLTLNEPPPHSNSGLTALPRPSLVTPIFDPDDDDSEGEVGTTGNSIAITGFLDTQPGIHMNGGYVEHNAASAMDIETDGGLSNGIKPPLSEQQPTLALMRRLDQDTIMTLIRHFYYWLAAVLDGKDPNTLDLNNQRRPPPVPTHESYSDPCITLSATDARWIFSLLAHLDSDLTTSKDISTLRDLVRACVCLIVRSLESMKAKEEARLVAVKPKPELMAQPESSSNDVYDDDGELIIPEPVSALNTTPDTRTDAELGRTGAWMIVTAIISIWGQTDLWSEAHARLYGGLTFGPAESVDPTGYEV